MNFKQKRRHFKLFKKNYFWWFHNSLKSKSCMNKKNAHFILKTKKRNKKEIQKRIKMKLISNTIAILVSGKAYKTMRMRIIVFKYFFAKRKR